MISKKWNRKYLSTRINTNKWNKILIGTEEGEDKPTQSIGVENVILGIWTLNEKLEGIGVLYIN